MGVPQFTQNFEVSATWAPQLVQKAIGLFRYSAFTMLRK